MGSPRDNANLPAKKAQCPRCKSTELKVVKRVTGEGTKYQTVVTEVLCLNCNHRWPVS